MTEGMYVHNFVHTPIDSGSGSVRALRRSLIRLFGGGWCPKFNSISCTVRRLLRRIHGQQWHVNILVKILSSTAYMMRVLDSLQHQKCLAERSDC